MNTLFDKSSTIVITSHKRIAPYLAMEVEALGFEVDEVFITGVKLTGTLKDCIKLNINLRCASQVLFLLDSFVVRHPDQLYRSASKIRWSDYIDEDAYISVTSNVQNDTINNNLFANLKVKDAIVDYYRTQYNKRPNTGSSLEGAVVHLHWKDDYASLYLDTSGHSLGRHGYRKIPGRAPMLEALAAATIYASKWDRKTSFVNPMCGSGTLAIEAALLARNITPGYFRHEYAFMHLKDYSSEYYEQAMDELYEAQIDCPDIQIIASDISHKAIENAEKNAIAAGVEDLIKFELCDFSKTTVPETDKGVVFLNPEYGERLGDIEDLEETYAAIGDFFKQKCKGYNAYIFTGNMDLAKKVGLKARRRIEFYNSKIDCKLFEYDIYDGTKKLHKIQNLES